MRTFFEVSGNDWWGNPQAPWNQPDAEYDNCPYWYDESDRRR